MSLLLKILADIRTVIAAVLGIFGLFLLVCSGFLNGEDEMAKTGGVNANLWAGPHRRGGAHGPVVGRLPR